MFLINGFARGQESGGVRPLGSSGFTKILGTTGIGRKDPFFYKAGKRRFCTAKATGYCLFALKKFTNSFINNADNAPIVNMSINSMGLILSLPLSLVKFTTVSKSKTAVTLMRLLFILLV